MRAMSRTTREIQLVLMTILALTPACRRTTQSTAPAPVERLALKPAAAARADLVAEIVVANLDRTLASVGAVAKKLNVPFSEADVKRLLTARTGAPEALVESVDRSKPLGVAVILVPKKDGGATREAAEPVIAAGLKAADKAGFDAFVALAGKVVERSKDAVKVQPSDAGGIGGAAWMLHREGAVCFAEELDRMVAGCELALAARKATAQDVRITLVPEGIARSSGTTLKQALEKMRAEISAEQLKATSAMSGKPPMQDGAAKTGQAMLGWFVDAIGDTAEGRIGLALDPAKGLATSFEVVPRPGSPLAKTVATRHAYAVDPALTGGAPGSVWAMGDMSFTRTIFDSLRGPLMEMVKSEADRAKANASIDALFEGLSGPFSARFSFEGDRKLSFVYDVIYTMKPGTDPKKLTAELESVMKAPWLSAFFDAASQGLMKFKLTSRRDGEALVTQVAMDTKKMPADMRAQLKTLPMFDGKPIEARTAVAGEKMIVAIGGTTKVRAAALAGSAGAPPAGELAAALAETKGDDAFYYTDLAALFRPLLSLAASGGLGPKGPGNQQATAMAGAVGAMLQNSAVATWGSYRGGNTATVTWRIPISTFETVGKVVAGVMGGGMR